MKLTRQQKERLREVYSRDWKKPSSFLKFRRTARMGLERVLFVPFAGMVLGIETDGHAHT